VNRALVGLRRGKPVINWPAVLLVGFVVGAVVGAVGSATWWLLTGEFRFEALVFPIPMAVGYFIGEAVRIRYRMPADELTVLD
jgi:hypothetical protein